MPMNLRRTLPFIPLAVLVTTLLLVRPMATVAAESRSPFDIDLRDLDQRKGVAAPASAPPQPAQPRPLPPAAPAAKTPSTPPAKQASPPVAAAKASPAARAAVAKAPPIRSKRSAPAPSAPPATSADGTVRYTVKPGDYLLRILVREFGLSDNEAEQLVPEVVRLNRIHDIRKLTVGQTLLIPLGQHPVVAREVTAAAPDSASLTPAAEPARPVPPEEPIPPPAEPSAPPASAPAPPVPPPTPPTAAQVDAPALVRFITGREPDQMVDSLLEALSLPVHRNAIIAVDGDGRENISVKVDRFFVDRGTRYVVSLADKDSYTYTLYRILEMRGYAVIQVGRDGTFSAIVGPLLERLGRTATAGRRTISASGGEREVTGYYVAAVHPREVGLFIADGTAAEGAQAPTGGKGGRTGTAR